MGAGGPEPSLINNGRCHTFLPKFTFYNLTYYRSVKKLIVFVFLLTGSISAWAQDTAATKSKKQAKAAEKERKSAILRQEEEGTLVFNKQNGFGIMLRTNGYGIFFEIGRRKTARVTNTYSIELTEIKHDKEEKQSGSIFSNPYIYGKINNFYQVKLGYGKQYILGQKGNKNGVTVIGIAQGGLSMGLLKPYYVNTGSDIIKYSDEDSSRFLNPTNNYSGAGFQRGWGELQLRPGAYLKTALRFDIGRYNESVSAIEIGMTLDAYAQKVSIMAPVTNDWTAAGPQRFFFQGHIAIVFGRRK
jgi:hypothetical protein